MSEQITALQNQLGELSQKLAAGRRIPAHLKALNKQITTRQKEFRLARRTLQKEEADVNKLLRASVKSLFYRFLKSQERQLAIELQEYVAAALTYNACLDEIELLEYEAGLLEEKLESLPKLETSWAKGIAEKEKLVKQHYPEIAGRLTGLENEALKVLFEMREIDEALIAGVKAKTYLKTIFKYLLKVNDWGHWPDGVGRYASYGKKSLIDKARKKAIQADLALNQFNQELADVFKKLEIADHFRVDAFKNFLDIFYNNLITDWIVQRNLKHTSNNVQAAIDNTERYLSSLRSEKKTRQKVLNNIELKKEDLIFNS